ncbi:MAG: hypothetical protein OHK0046_38690 [Anaerolineae bacterium]
MQHNQIEFHHIEQEIYIEGSAEKTFEALLDVNGWWAQRFVPKPDSLWLETRVGGRFWESRDGSEDNGFLWGTVTSIEPNDHIVLTGSIGMQGAIVGNVTLCTIPQDDGRTQVSLSHHILGQISERLLEGFKAGWQTNLKMLKQLVETGKRVAPPIS